MAATTAAQVRRPRSIAIYLFVLALVALVPAFAFSAILLQRNNDAQERVVEALITGSTRSIMQTVDREVFANISTLRVLATTKMLESGDLKPFYDQITIALAGTDSYVYVLDSSFYSIMSTRGEFGMPPRLAKDTDTPRRALESREVVVSGLVINSAGIPVFNVLLPVFTGKLAPVVLGFSRDAISLNTALLSDKLPAGWNVAIIDQNGSIIAASAGGGDTGQPFGLPDVARMGTTSGLVSLTADGVSYRGAVRNSPLTGWTVISWAPSRVISQPLIDSVWSLAVGGLVLALIVVLVVYSVTVQIGRSVRGLEADAKRLGTGQPVTARDYPISEIATVSAALEEASRRRQQAATEVRFLMRELAHRSKNQMTVIAAMAKQTARSADSVPEFVKNFEKRIFGLARSTDLLLANGVVGVDLKELITSQIDPFCPTDSERVKFDGPSVRLNNQAAQIIGMAAHELATNSVKYGAFYKDVGILAVSWSRDAEALHVVWRETTPDFKLVGDHRGFGTAVLENMVGRSLGAKVERIVHADGLEWRFSIPAAGIEPGIASADAERPAA